jgi:hypothetical protein
MAVFALLLGLATASFVGSLTRAALTAGVPIALASVAASDKEERNEDKKHGRDAADKGHDGDADHVARGQVIGINNLKDPPELTLAAIDGAMLVRVVKTDEIALNGLKLCDYVTLQGEKINEQLFDANQISVDDHRC